MLILFVHGALVRDADWWWHRMPDRLAGLGFRTAAVELPSWVGRADLAADAAAVRAALAAADQARAGRTVEIPTGHHPFLSRPDLFAETRARTLYAR